MQTPTKEQAEGYDVLIWLDDDGDIMLRAYTEQGEDFLVNYCEDYSRGDLVELSDIHPEEFAVEIPTAVMAGFLNSEDGVIYTLPKPVKH